MLIQRRAFLGAMGVALAGLTIPIIADKLIPAAIAAPVIEPVVATESKYVVALRMMDGVIAARQHPVIMHPRMDALFDYIHTNFDEPVYNAESRAASKDLLCNYGYNTDEMIRKVPPVIIDAVWPIAVMKLLLRDYALPLNHRKLTSFKMFHDRYGKFILEA